MVQRIDITLDGLRQLLDRVERQQLDADDWSVVFALVSKVIARGEAQYERMRARIAADEAHKGAAPSEADAVDAEHTHDVEPSNDASAPNAASSAGAAEPSGATLSGGADPAHPPADPPGGEPRSKTKGHGRNGADAYVNAKHTFHRLMPGVLGRVCEKCGRGRVSRYAEKIIIRIVGQPLFGAEMHHYDQARCRICGDIIRATGPASVLEGVGTSYVIYDWSACAMLAVMHYFGGAPFKRLESFHNGWGVPLADANQWNVVDASDDLLRPLYKAIELHGIHNATTLRIDDTGSMVIETMREIHDEIDALKLVGKSTTDVRTGINVTGVYLETPDGTTILFYTGRHHAGEIIDQMLRHRRLSSPKLVKVTDGASKNFDHKHADKLIEATCNAHAFLKFRAIKDKYPAEYALAGEVYKKVFDNDDHAKARELTATERMLYHQQHSKPLMEKLKAMCEEKIKSKLVEPRSPLWEPVSFLINQWSRLTKFYQEPGVPLDTNVVEQTLIIPVRYLAGSFSYKTANGAEVGDRHMSLVATARAAGVEPVAYLTHCLRNHEDLAKRPEYYLPWIYRERLKAEDKPP